MSSPCHSGSSQPENGLAHQGLDEARLGPSALRALCVVAWTLFAATAVCSESPPEAERLSFSEIASGTWGFDAAGAGCDDNPHTIVFSKDEPKMTLRYASAKADNTSDTFVYEIIGEGPGYMRMRLIGEERTTDSGEPAVWDLVLLSGDSYCWHRADWKPGACTKPAKRCPSDEG